ncbi:p-hydroxyphenylacetate 3-hydroxylase, oxygenase component [Serratia fonticola]|uniref:p-hydroxyphenylacetate 3-hydroxylase, oxygenase component n=1 Tax=Serratia fonticola TaxID=47917 RepID=A0A4U9TS58_SERFO|nr:p-hydroxyphenylacetate 3-hydroxylase, oxygenase component [Serratia fonticola]
MGWSSGCDHAEWAIVGFRRKNADGELIYSFGVIPRSDYEIRDDWFAVGMRGSGSKTLVIKNAFVPKPPHRSRSGYDARAHLRVSAFTQTVIFSTRPIAPISPAVFAAISLGVAERMLVAFKEKTQNRVRAYTGASVGTATRR